MDVRAKRTKENDLSSNLDLLSNYLNMKEIVNNMLSIPEDCSSSDLTYTGQRILQFVKLTL